MECPSQLDHASTPTVFLCSGARGVNVRICRVEVRRVLVLQSAQRKSLAPILAVQLPRLDGSPPRRGRSRNVIGSRMAGARIPALCSPLAIGSYLVHCIQNEMICAAAGPFDRPAVRCGGGAGRHRAGAAYRPAIGVTAANAPAAHRPHRPRASPGPPGRPARGVLWCQTGPEVTEPFGRLHRTQLGRRRLALQGVAPGRREAVRGGRPGTRSRWREASYGYGSRPGGSRQTGSGRV